MISLAKEALDAIRRHAVATFPEECCGILVGNRSGDPVVAEAVAAENVAAGDRRRRYEIDPRALLRVHREVRETGREVVGYYHSHPRRPPVPSAFDREHAWPEVSYLIVAVDGVTDTGGDGTEIRCWRLTEDGWDEEPWTS